jgi:hypothetical protein
MWIRRTSEEVGRAKREHRSTRIRTAIFMGGVVTILTAFVYGGKFNAPKLIPFNQVISRIPLSIILGGIMGIISYWFALREDRQLVCPKCGKVKFRDGILECSCGGHFEKIEEMKWHDDGKKDAERKNL